MAHLQLKAIDSGCALESLGPCEDLDEEIQLLVQERWRLPGPGWRLMATRNPVKSPVEGTVVTFMYHYL